MPSHYQLWAKANKNDCAFHPLIYHMIDVGACARAIWDQSLSIGFRKRMKNVLSGVENEDEAGNLIAFLAALHDIGKASPSFQQKHESSIDRIKEAGFEFPAAHGQSPTPHGIITAWALTEKFKEIFDMEAYSARRIAYTLGGHHGVLPATSTVNRLSAFDKGNETWDHARHMLIEELRRVFPPPETFHLPAGIEEQNAVLMLLLGLTTTADWLGSDERFFDYEDRFLAPEEYVLCADEKAQKALVHIGWRDGWKPSGETIPFTDMFPFPPRRIQAAVIEAAEDLSFPSLTILEAPTGIGKTEVALYLADTWLQKERGRGLYIAMPTQATSNQIFKRTLEFLDERYDQKIHIQLAHGQALWNENMKKLCLTSVGEGPVDSENRMSAETWFLPRKKTLLAPFGVGTVDQALMGVLQSRHFYLRLFGLANKVVIFDEVHAYDTYMSQLFLRLLHWLRAVGSSVIVLSATLPEATRRAMVEVFSPEVLDGSRESYPRLTLVTPLEERIISLPEPADRTIQLERIAETPEFIAQFLEDKLSQGGCAAVICNTVGRAQDVYTSLKQHESFKHETLILFHSRFPPAWRKTIEERVLGQFEKLGNRPQKAIVVATQVIEQSLDLDFDLMVSDLAPVDLLIQRIGRLHRHERDVRPAGLQVPQLALVQPEEDNNEIRFGSSEYVYERYILWKTWLEIKDRSQLHLPGETIELIESVYGDFDGKNYPQDAVQLQEARLNMEKRFLEDSYKAETNLVPQPDVETLVTHPMQDLRDDEDPTIHHQLKAVTRLIPPGVHLVCLHEMDDGSLNTEPDGAGTIIDLEEAPDNETIEELLRYSITLNRHDLVRALAGQTHPPWGKSTVLRYHIPLIFRQSRVSIRGADLTLLLQKELGLQVEKEVL